MSLIEEYGKNKEKKGIAKGRIQGISQGESKEQERIIKNQLKSGMSAKTISQTAKIPLTKVKTIEKEIKEDINFS